jgi:hypothetical protein
MPHVKREPELEMLKNYMYIPWALVKSITMDYYSRWSIKFLFTFKKY